MLAAGGISMNEGAENTVNYIFMKLTPEGPRQKIVYQSLKIQGIHFDPPAIIHVIHVWRDAGRGHWSAPAKYSSSVSRVKTEPGVLHHITN